MSDWDDFKKQVDGGDMKFTQEKEAVKEVEGKMAQFDEDGFPQFCELVDLYIDPKQWELWSDVVKETYKKHWKTIRMTPASSSGKYHHWCENLRPYGLINHHLRAVWMVKELSREEEPFYSDKVMMASEKHIKRIVATFLHDFGKLDTFAPWHGNISLSFMPEIVRQDEKVKGMIRSHMHRWVKSGNPPPASTTGQRIVAYGDYMASRSQIEVTGLGYLYEYEGKTYIITKKEQLQNPEGQ